MTTPALEFGPSAPRARLKKTLDVFIARSDPASLVASDPVALVHPYTRPEDREVVGLLVAMLAYGRVAAIKDKAQQLLSRLGPHPARAIDEGQVSSLNGFIHRFQKGDDLVRFCRAIGHVRQTYGGLGEAFSSVLQAGDPHYGDTMARFIGLIRTAIPGELSYGLRFLLPSPSSGGAAKRLCLYLRWMIRPEDGLDLGTWTGLGLTPDRLVIPLDTHIGRIARYLGLTDRKANDFRTAVEITDALRRLSPDDPLRYDMALCHLGISGQCPRKRDVSLCRGCPIRAVCRLGPVPAGWGGATWP